MTIHFRCGFCNHTWDYESEHPFKEFGARACAFVEFGELIQDSPNSKPPCPKCHCKKKQEDPK